MEKNTVVACYHLDGRFVRIYPSAFVASQKMHISRNGIYDCLKGRKKSCHNYMWKEFSIDDEIPNTIEPYKAEEKPNSIKVSQYDLKGKLVATYSSIQIASKKLGVVPSSIAKCVNGEFKTVKGFYFIKENDIEKIKYLLDNNNYYYSEIIQIDLNKKVVAVYKTPKEAEKATGINSRTITQAIRKKGTAFGYYWRGKKESSSQRTIKRVVACYTYEGNLVSTYKNAKEAATSLGLFARSVDKAIRMNTSVGGYQWRRYESQDYVLQTIAPYKREIIDRASKVVIRIDKKGNKVEFKSIRFASKESNVSAKQIRECLLGHQKQAGGYRWKLKYKTTSSN